MSSRTYKIGVVLDARRYERVRGTPLEQRAVPIFGGALKMVEIEVSEETARRLLQEFPRSRIDARGFIEELPVAFKRRLFELMVELGKADEGVVRTILERHLDEVKEQAAKEEEYVPPP